MGHSSWRPGESHFGQLLVVQDPTHAHTSLRHSDILSHLAKRKLRGDERQENEMTMPFKSVPLLLMKVFQLAVKAAARRSTALLRLVSATLKASSKLLTVSIFEFICDEFMYIYI